MNPDDLRAIAEKPLTLEKRAHEAMLTGHLAPSTAPAYAAFRQAFNPSTCLALLDELDGLKAQLSTIRKEATDAEREACAKIADVTKGAAVYAFWSGERACHSVAESIRARSNLPGSRAPTGDEGK